MRFRNRNKYFYLLVIVFLTIFALCILYGPGSNKYTQKRNYYEDFITSWTESYGYEPKQYLVNTSACKIVDMNPTDPSIAVAIKEATVPKCEQPLVYFKHGVFLINEHHPKYKTARCCYNEINRLTVVNYTQWTADWTNSYSLCHPIPPSTSSGGEKLKSKLVKINCKYTERLRLKKWTDYGVTVLPPERHSEQTKAKHDYWKRESVHHSNSKPPNVLIIAIDSISRLHMIRSLPETKQFLEANDFVEMKGYTKIGENTFPNMMAAIGGMKLGDYPCWRSRSQKMDDCTFIWKNFSSQNYITGLLEDSAALAIFNYMKTGFVEQPVDYYLRPLAVAYHGSLNREAAYDGCVGGLTQTDLLLKYIADFVSGVNHQVPYFFLSWFTVLAHDDFNALRGFDSKFKSNLEQLLESEGNDTIILFMSDHGYRFGDFRETFQGYYEESLPFFFIRLPPSVKRRFPHWTKNLKVNSERLTSPLDLHATFEDILSLSSNQERSTFTHGNWDPHFRAVYSFFEETPVNRTCESSNIPDQFCRCDSTCGKTVDIERFDTSVGEKLVENVNSILAEQIENSVCVSLSFKRYLYVRQLQMTSEGTAVPSHTDYVIGLEASPSGAKFEAKCTDFTNGDFNVIGNVSRINSYKGQSDCVEDSQLKGYCYCNRLGHGMVSSFLTMLGLG